jgi:hypothetical protein
VRNFQDSKSGTNSLSPVLLSRSAFSVKIGESHQRPMVAREDLEPLSDLIGGAIWRFTEAARKAVTSS